MLHPINRLHLIVGEVSLAPNAVVPAVVLLVDVAFVPHPLEELLDNRSVLFVRRPDEGVVVDRKLLPQRLELAHDAVDKHLGFHPFLGGSRGNLLAMLIGSSDERGLIALEALKGGNNIRCHGRVRAPHVRRPIGVVQRSREHKRLVLGGGHAPASVGSRRAAGGGAGEDREGPAGEGEGVERAAEHGGGGEEGVGEGHRLSR
mmetsp:Transcript_30584/g.76984  ORF Transcript_30584/g.76984 Transcript_30584/m.76984 type:complete len:203 (+) Transcript_30584:1878-2486(+)